MSEPDNGFAMLARVQAEAGHLPSVAWVLGRIELWVADDSPRPLKLQRYLKLPSTPLQRRHYLRDRWLARAAEEVEAPGIWTGALALVSAMESFVSRGPFARWRDAGGPPEGAASFDKSLFHALELNGGRCLGPDRLLQIEAVSSALSRKIDSTSPSIAHP